MTGGVGATRRRFRSAGMLVALSLLAALVSAPAAARAEVGAGAQLASSAPASRATTRAITIGTVPPVVGFPVILDGVTDLTDAAGKAHFTTSEEGLSEHIALNEAVIPIDGRPVQVAASRVFYGANGDAARLALDLSYQVQFRFSSMTGEPVDDSVIDTVTVKSVTGAVATLPAHEVNWLQGSRVVPLSGGLEVKLLDWTVQRVEYSGSNVVNASQQKFLPAQEQNVVVNLLFYRVSLSSRDAFFGFPQSGAVDLVYPDGATQRFQLDEHGRLTLPTLPRGNYTITTLGSGPTMTRPLALSRDQDVELNFYSWLDIGAVAVLVLVLALGLPLIGWRRRRRDRRVDPPDEDESIAHPTAAPAAIPPEVART